MSDKIHRTGRQLVNEPKIHAKRFRKATYRTGFASRSEDEDETWLAEFAGHQTKAGSRVAETLGTKKATFQPNPKSHLCADPSLPRTTQLPVTPNSNSAALCRTNGYEYDSPGPESRDYDEDSSANVLNLDCADHVLSSNRGVTTLDHD